MKDSKDFKFYWEKERKGKRADEGVAMHIIVPGYARDEISVKLTASSIRVSAEKKHHRKEKGKGFYREEAVSTSFSKFVTLPHRIDPAGFDVVIEDGKVTMRRKRKKEKELAHREGH